MPKMTKAQIRRSLKMIKSKSRKLFVVEVPGDRNKVVLRTNDIVAIDKIVDAALKRLG
jgi:hypothetical protein